ncbi:MAG: DUF4976 domain-containing protein [Gammaproteobacteria bacterium]|nr:DUF4976 domain-containing protein [Gammaproteobacteria bacterium]
MDFYPTLLDAAGLARDEDLTLDGVSLLPVLRGEPLEREAIYFHYPNYAFHRSNRLGSAIRAGKWKLIERFDDGSLELYDLEADLSEQKNLAETHGEKARQLQRKLVAWRAESKAAMPRRAE